MSRSADPGHFFQTSSSLSEVQRKEQKSKNTLGDPIQLPAKVLCLERHPLKTDEVFAGCSDGCVRLLKLQSPSKKADKKSDHKPIHATLRGSDGPVTCLTSSTDTLYAGSWDKSIHAFSLSSLQPLRRYDRGHTDFVKAVAVGRVKTPRSSNDSSVKDDSPTSTELLISGGADGYVVVWNAGTGEKLYVLRGHSRGVLALAVQLHHDLVAQSGEVPEELVVWSADSVRGVRRWRLTQTEARAVPFREGTEEKEEWVVHETSVNALRFSINENTMKEGVPVLDIVTASADKSAKKFLLEVKDSATPIERAMCMHEDFVKDAIMVPGTTWMATACRDENVRFWDVDVERFLGEGEEDVVFDGHFEEVTTLCLAEREGEQVVISGSIDGTVRTWPATVEGVERWTRERELLRQKEKENVKVEEQDVKESETKTGVQLTEDEERELAELMDDD